MSQQQPQQQQPTLILEPVTAADIPHLSPIWFAAFTDPISSHLWPDTPLVRAWWDTSNTLDLHQKPHIHRFLKIVDTSTIDPSTHQPRIAAYAKWDLSSPQERGQRYPDWCSDQPGEECTAFFDREEAERQRVMGAERHYYLDTLATHPDYQRRGCGGMLVRWGVHKAEEDEVGAYVDASPAGKGLYERCGFVDESLEGVEDVASMAIHRK